MLEGRLGPLRVLGVMGGEVSSAIIRRDHPKHHYIAIEIHIHLHHHAAGTAG